MGLSCPWSWTRSTSSKTIPPPPRSASVPPLVPSAPRLPPSPPTATLPSTRCTTPPATSPSLSRVRLQHQLPVRLPVLQPWRLRRLHRPLQLLQGLQKHTNLTRWIDLRHPEP